jgi:hypothetical protein
VLLCAAQRKIVRSHWLRFDVPLAYGEDVWLQFDPVALGLAPPPKDVMPAVHYDGSGAAQHGGG